ncbi:FAD-dependent monooxygenase [Fodinicola acaciae]|uniref:FAD-dependent monooxygenase n=1 Tax=Fodinicola acaciae TaxID=2681555 RepID=UPI0013D81C10|nr:FAD-dependent monooxygenase [Fodinicola acaciae]
MNKTDVLIAGGGLVGLASALFLSRQGIRPVLVDRHPGVSIHGRARGINPRTMEIYRAYGVAEAVERAGKPFDEEAGVARCHTLAGEWEWLFDADEPRTSPDTAGVFCMADQNTVEPILIEAATSYGAEHLFDTELLSFEETENGIVAEIQNRTGGERRTVRADYLIAADGNRSPIRQRLGIARTGEATFMHSMNIVFRADLSPYLPRRALFWMIFNENVGGGLVSTVDPQRWQLTVTYDPLTESEASFPDERCISLVRAAIGADIDVTIEGVAAWEQGLGVAERFRAGRVFLAGDSAHVWPPAAALGANTGVQDAHNLAWKLAHVIRGIADDSLLDTYDAERRPLAEALAPMIVGHQQARMSGQPEPDGTNLKPFAQVYGGPTPFADTLTPARVGGRAPHLWLADGLAVHDVCVDSYVLLCDSDEWLRAAQGRPVRAYRADASPDWARLYGCSAALVRPDGYVAWLTSEPADAELLDNVGAWRPR